MNTPKRRRPDKKQLQKDLALVECVKTSIKDLPRDVLIKVLSFLPTTDAVKTTIISRPWRDLWYSVPLLNFDMITFLRNNPGRSTEDLFAKFISQTLIHRPIHFPLQKFKLWFCDTRSVRVQSSVDSWLEKVISRRVAELDLRFQGDSNHFPQEAEDDEGLDGFTFYKFQFRGLGDSAVEVLKLHGIELRVPGEAFPLKCDSIREVFLKNFHSSDKDIEQLVAVCVNLESLSLVGGWGCQRLKIVSRKLKHLKLFSSTDYCVEDSSIDIDAPNLGSIDLACLYTEKFFMKETPSLVEAKVDFVSRGWSSLNFWPSVVSSLCGIERLAVKYLWPWSLENHPRKEVFSNTLVFRNLKHVKICFDFSDCEIGRLDNLFLRAPQLTSMVLISTNRDKEEFDVADFMYDSDEFALPEGYKDTEGFTNDPVEFSLPSLKLVEIKAYGATLNERFVVNLLMQYGEKLEKIIAYPSLASEISQARVVLFDNSDLP